MNIIESQWEKAQQHIFIEWINEVLPETPIHNLQEDTQDGILLIRLVEKLNGKKCHEKRVDHPKLRIQKISNCTVALHFIQSCYNMKTFCSAENIVDSTTDAKYLLGLLFQLYMKHHKTLLISSQQNLDNQYNLLLQWLQGIIGEYGIELRNKTELMNNFYNGKILIALLDKFFEQEYSFFNYMLEKGEGERIGISMRMAHDLLGVTELLTTEDVIAHQVDSRVFFFYFDFMMNAFKTKSRIQNIDLVQLVEEGLKRLHDDMMKEQNEMKPTEELEEKEHINLSQFKKQLSPMKLKESHQSIDLQQKKKKSTSSSTSDDDESEEDDDYYEKQRIQSTQSTKSKPIVLKDVLKKGRVQLQQQQSPKDIFEDPDEYEHHQSKKTQLHESYTSKHNQPTVIHRKHHDISPYSHHKHTHHYSTQKQKQINTYTQPTSYSQTTERTITTTSHGTTQQTHHRETSHTTISYSFYLL